MNDYLGALYYHGRKSSKCNKTDTGSRVCGDYTYIGI